MKTISIQVTDEEHKEIKLAATQNGQSIKDYLLNSRPDEGYSLQDFKDGKPQADMKAQSGVSDTSKGQGTPKSGLESLDKDQFHGPLFRDKRKGKI